MHNPEYTKEEALAQNGAHFIKDNSNKDPTRIPDPKKRSIIPIREDELTDAFYEFTGTRFTIPKRGFVIEEGDIKRIPKTMLDNPQLTVFLKVRTDVAQDATPLQEKTMMQVNAGKIEKSVPILTAKQIEDLKDQVRIGDPSAIETLKHFELTLEEAAGKVDNSTGRVFDDLEVMLNCKRKKILGL